MDSGCQHQSLSGQAQGGLGSAIGLRTFLAWPACRCSSAAGLGRNSDFGLGLRKPELSETIRVTGTGTEFKFRVYVTITIPSRSQPPQALGRGPPMGSPWLPVTVAEQAASPTWQFGSLIWKPDPLDNFWSFGISLYIPWISLDNFLEEDLEDIPCISEGERERKREKEGGREGGREGEREGEGGRLREAVGEFRVTNISRAPKAPSSPLVTVATGGRRQPATELSLRAPSRRSLGEPPAGGPSRGGAAAATGSGLRPKARGLPAGGGASKAGLSRFQRRAHCRAGQGCQWMRRRRIQPP